MIDIPALLDDWPWGGAGRDLDELDAPPHPWTRVVACLNIWNDANELRQTLPRWIDHVDAVIAVDGVYRGTETAHPQSTDGTLDYLASIPKVQIIPCPPEAWENQLAKRSAYFHAAREGDLLWVVDADEYVEGAAALRAVPFLDAGWVTFRSPLYRRPAHTPRLFRWRPDLRYDGRHYWVYAGDRLLASHTEGGAGFLHRLVPLAFFNSRGALRDDAYQYAIDLRRVRQLSEESRVGETHAAHDPLRIFQLGAYDAGFVLSRLHTALNTTTPHQSALATPEGHPFAPPVQHLLPRDRLTVRDIAHTADIVHNHVTYGWWDLLDLRPRCAVMHHHGTEYRQNVETYNAVDAERVGLRLVSNLELLQYGDDLHYLPNPVPVARYQRLRAPRSGPFRVGHSPSKRNLKGTDVFLRVCDRLKVEPVLIEKQTIRQSLETKATCDAFFDSFWLGMQCSGLEAAAMGMPVIAGDVDCRREAIARYGAVPYTWANDEAGLAEAIERLAHDTAFYDAERLRVSQHVLAHHDCAAVARSYLALIDGAFAWREHLTLRASPPPMGRSSAA